METPTIEENITENTFELHGHPNDRFTHVILCDSDGTALHAAQYMYARNIKHLRENSLVVPADKYPEFKQYAVEDEVLTYTSDDSETLRSLIDMYDNILPKIHAECLTLRKLGLFNRKARTSIRNRLLEFLKLVRLGNFSGESIVWLPENYRGEQEFLKKNEGEDDEDFMRRKICTHIKCRRLHMAHIISPSEKRLKMMDEILTWMDMGYSIILETHFVSLARDQADGAKYALNSLMADEFRRVKNDEPIDDKSICIFSDEYLDRHKFTVNTEEARQLLKYYVGDYLDNLDLSRTFITGSAITACLMRCQHSPDILQRRKNEIDILYPPVLTTISDRTLALIKKEDISLWSIKALSETEGMMTFEDLSIRFQIRPGSDVDMVVDNTVTDDEYRAIALKHFTTIKALYPSIKMKEFTKAKGDWNYIIYTDDPELIPFFRTVEIYRSSFRNICSHHVGAVRGCYTSYWASDDGIKKPTFYLTASAVYTSIHKASPNYHYFAGKKCNPQDVLIKNLMRGFRISDEVLAGYMAKYMHEKGIVISKSPFYQGSNIPFSLFSVHKEEGAPKTKSEEQNATPAQLPSLKDGAKDVSGSNVEMVDCIQQ